MWYLASVKGWRKQWISLGYWLGTRKKDGTCRSIIILFAFHHYRDIVWQSARDCKFLRDNKLRFTEALSPEDMVAGEKLWPVVKKARDEGKKASFHGSFALIDRKRFEYASVK
ncbi:nucleoside diphosphate-linked moiety X motif 22 [Labeo rohita]|uniref:Nucleoside diphosphate-linked moiety X motif 22 n=1 Tax=Labeo rohita TaxID=84645 RepID=A0A498NZ80_LABRO|nr:nucleoside diphosphate-linked moiety X motif 22 [Labeo rohita]RXN37570.1 nucleoside diphosphate-linked moiety X motif 22 [Labeo rohita]